MLTRIATATLDDGWHAARYRTAGAWDVAQPGLASINPTGVLVLDRHALAASLYTGLLARALVGGAPKGSVVIPAGGRAAAPVRLSDTASVLPVVTWTDGAAGTGVDPSIRFQLPGRVGQTWPAEATVELYLVEAALAQDAPAAPAPGAYATAQDMVDRFGADEIAELLALPRGADAAAIAASPKMARALADTATEIDAALAMRYDLPLAAGTYPLLRNLACDIARRRLYDEQPTDAVRNAASRARSQLKLLASGDLVLLSDDGMTVIPRADTGILAERIGREPVLDDDAWAGF